MKRLKKKEINLEPRLSVWENAGNHEETMSKSFDRPSLPKFTCKVEFVARLREGEYNIQNWILLDNSSDELLI